MSLFHVHDKDSRTPSPTSRDGAQLSSLVDDATFETFINEPTDVLSAIHAADKTIKTQPEREWWDDCDEERQKLIFEMLEEFDWRYLSDVSDNSPEERLFTMTAFVRAGLSREVVKDANWLSGSYASLYKELVECLRDYYIETFGKANGYPRFRDALKDYNLISDQVWTSNMSREYGVDYRVVNNYYDDTYRVPKNQKPTVELSSDNVVEYDSDDEMGATEIEYGSSGELVMSVRYPAITDQITRGAFDNGVEARASFRDQANRMAALGTALHWIVPIDEWFANRLMRPDRIVEVGPHYYTRKAIPRPFEERWSGRHPVRAFLDVDIKGVFATDLDEQQLANAFSFVATEWGVEPEVSKPIIWGYVSEVKSSFHILSYGFVLPDSGATKKFATDVQNYLTQTGSRCAEWIDVQACGGDAMKEYGLRPANVPKVKKMKHTEEEISRSEKLGIPLPREKTYVDFSTVLKFRPKYSANVTLAYASDIANCFLQYKLSEFPFPDWTEGSYMIIGEETKRKPAEIVATGDIAVEDLKSMVATVHEKFPYLQYVPKSRNGRAIASFNIKPGSSGKFTCSVCQRSHDNRQAYIDYMPNGRIVLRCRGYGKREPASSLKERGIFNVMHVFREATRDWNIVLTPDNIYDGIENMIVDPTKVTNISLATGTATYNGKQIKIESTNKTRVVLDEYDIVKKATRVNGQYNAEVIPDDGVSDLYIQSSWNTGKSYFNAQAIRQTLSRNKNAKIISFSGRRALSAQMCENMKATSYTEIEGMLDPDVYHNTVFQIDSIRRVPYKYSFDLLILDEIAQTINQMKDNDANASMLKYVITNAKRIIVSDNDLSERIIQAVKMLREGKPSSVFVNEYKPFAGVPCKTRLSGKGSIQMMDEMREYALECYSEYKTTGALTKGFVVPCSSKSKAEELNAMFQQMFPDDKQLIMLYTALTDDKVKANDFRNATESWGKKMIVIYSPTVSVGVDARCEHLTRVYAFLHNNSAPVTQSVQMIFRARFVKEIFIEYSGLKFAYGLPTYHSQLVDSLYCKSHNLSLPASLNMELSPFHDLLKTSFRDIKDPDYARRRDIEYSLSTFEGRLFEIRRIDEYRSKSAFLARASAIMENAGIVVTHVSRDEVKDYQSTTNVKSILREAKRVVTTQQAKTAMANVRETATEYHALSMQRENANTMYDEPTKLQMNAQRVMSRMHIDPFTEHAVLEGNQGWYTYYKQVSEKYVRLGQIINHMKVSDTDPRDWTVPGWSCAAKIDTQERVSSHQISESGPSILDPIISNVSKFGGSEEAQMLTCETFKALGLRIDTDETQYLQVSKLEEPDILALVAKIDKRSRQLYGDTNMSRERKPKTIINHALGYVGASIRPRTKNDKATYVLEWEWAVDEAPKPRPKHPVKGLEYHM